MLFYLGVSFIEYFLEINFIVLHQDFVHNCKKLFTLLFRFDDEHVNTEIIQPLVEIEEVISNDPYFFLWVK